MKVSLGKQDEALISHKKFYEGNNSKMQSKYNSQRKGPLSLHG